MGLMMGLIAANRKGWTHANVYTQIAECPGPVLWGRQLSTAGLCRHRARFPKAV